jgi:tetratricopeptide (TPR) repeat protein
MRRPKEATAALLTYVRLVEGGAEVQFGTATNAPPAGDDEDDTPPNASTALTQAFLLLAQAAEQQRDYAGAERWLARVDNPQRALEVQARRASLLARQGKIKEARELIRKVPEHSPSDARAKLLAETELLRERKMYAEAEQVMAQASKAFPDDTDLLYEQAMLNEKLDRMDEMERLLPCDRAQARPPARLQRARLLARDRNIRLPKRAPDPKALELSPGEPSMPQRDGSSRLGNHERRSAAAQPGRART